METGGVIVKSYFDVSFEGVLVRLPDPDPGVKGKETVEEIRQPWALTRRDVEANNPTAAVTSAIRDVWHPLANLWLSDDGAYFLIGKQVYPRLEMDGAPVDSFAKAVPLDRALRLNGQVSLIEDDHV